MKSFLLIVIVFASHFVVAQNFSRTFDAERMDELQLTFKYPELIKVKTWDKNQVLITGKVNINNGTQNEAFEVRQSREGKKLAITSVIIGADTLPKMIMINNGNGQKYYFKTADTNDPAVQSFLEENIAYNYMSVGILKEIELEITVPKHINLTVDAKYGLVELEDAPDNIYVNSKYGGVDIVIPSVAKRTIKARTKFGEMFTDMHLNIQPENDPGYFKWQTVSADLNGGGEECYLESEFGNLYLRQKK